MGKTIVHTGISVSDLERSLEFYRDLLGMELLFTDQDSREDLGRGVGVPGANMKFAVVQMGDGVLELIEYVEPRGRAYERSNNDVGAMHVAFTVDDIETVYQELFKKGVQFITPPIYIPAGPMKGWKWTYFFDPDGIQLELMQAP